MKKKTQLKGFTVIESIVSIAIISVIVMIATILIRTGVPSTTLTPTNEIDYSFINPQIESARAQRRMADELQRQNDLMQRRIELHEQTR